MNSNSIILVFVLTWMLSCQPMPESNSQEKQQALIEAYIQAYNQFDVEGMTQNLHDQVVFQNVSQGEVDMNLEGKEAFQTQAEAAKAYFSERKQTITSWDFQDNQVTIDIDYVAILAMDFPNGMKAGDTLQMKGQSAFVFEGEKIIRITDKS